MRWIALTVAVACHGTPTAAVDASVAQPVTSPDPKVTAATIRQFYPIDCAANDASWKWATCHDETKGFDAILGCTTAARDQAKAAAARLPPATEPNPDAPCSGRVEAKSRAFVTGTAMYLDDLVTWLTARKATLVGPLRAGTIQDLDDKLKAGMPQDWDAKYADAGEMLIIGEVNTISCTKALYRCGTEENPANKLTYIDCDVQAAAVRLGVECGTSSPYHHADGTRYCPAMICDLNNPRTWLYDVTTKQRIP